MENMEGKDITIDAIEEITEAVPNDKSGLKAIVKNGVFGVTCVLAWEFGMKPILRFVKGKIAKRKANKTSENRTTDDNDADDDDLSIPGEDE